MSTESGPALSSAPQPSGAPTSLRTQFQVLLQPKRLGKTSPIPSLPSLLPSLLGSLCSSNTPVSSGTALPQGLCTDYSPYPENPFPGNFHTDRSLASFKSLFQCPNFTVRSP